jgi:hypothetical protein
MIATGLGGIIYEVKIRKFKEYSAFDDVRSFKRSPAQKSRLVLL